MNIAEVHWIDAYASTSATSVKKAEKNKGILTITVGFVIAETDAGLTLAMDWWPDDPKDANVHTFIPWEMVLTWFVYKGVPHGTTVRSAKP